MFKYSPLFILSLSATLLMVGVGMIVTLLPQRVHAMTGSLESVGLVASAFALAYLLAQLPIGILSDRLGPERFLVIGYLLCALSGLTFLLTQTAGGIYLGRAIQGLGEAPIWALGPAVLSLAYPSAKGRAIGIYNAAIHAGLTVGPLLGLLIAPEGQSDLPFLIFAGLCITGGIIVLVFLRPSPVPAHRSKPDMRQFLAVLSQRKLPSYWPEFCSTGRVTGSLSASCQFPWPERTGLAVQQSAGFLCCSTRSQPIANHRRDYF